MEFKIIYFQGIKKYFLVISIVSIYKSQRGSIVLACFLLVQPRLFIDECFAVVL